MPRDRAGTPAWSARRMQFRSGTTQQPETTGAVGVKRICVLDVLGHSREPGGEEQEHNSAGKARAGSPDSGESDGHWSPADEHCEGCCSRDNNEDNGRNAESSHGSVLRNGVPAVFISRFQLLANGR